MAAETVSDATATAQSQLGGALVRFFLRWRSLPGRGWLDVVPADTRPPRARSLWRDRPLSVSGMVDERRALVGAESSATCTVSMDMEPVSSMPVVTATRSASLMTTAEDDPVRERKSRRRTSTATCINL